MSTIVRPNRLQPRCDVYSNISFGAAKSINKNLRFKICVKFGEFSVFKYIFIKFAVPNLMII